MRTLYLLGGYFKRQNIVSFGENVEKTEPLHTAERNCTFIHSLWETAWKFLKTLKVAHMTQSSYIYKEHTL